MNAVRAGRTARVCGRGDWVVKFLGNERLDRKLMRMDRSLVKMARDVAITSGEMYPVLGISLRSSWTRSRVEKRNFGSVGNGTARNLIFLRRGADPPRNISEITGGVPALQLRERVRRIGNGSCMNVAHVSS
jgi:hypothetical protein